MHVFAGVGRPVDPREASGTTEKVGRVRPAEDVEGTKVHRVVLPYDRGRARTVSTYTRALADFCRQEQTRPDVVQLMTITPWSLRGLVQLKRLEIPTVYTRTMIPDPSISRFRQVLWSIPWRLVDCIVVSSGVMRDWMRDLGLRGRIEVISNGVDLERFKPLSSAAEKRRKREQLGLDPEGEIILFMGGVMSPRKGIDLLLSAWHRISEARPRAYLVLVGPHQAGVRSDPRQEAFIRGMKESIADSSSPERVIVTGKVDKVEEYFQAADLNVFPSRREGMPNVVPEAFACALPSVLTPFVGLPAEFGHPDQQYVLVDHDPAAIAASVLSLLKDTTRRDRLGREGRRWVIEQLSLDASLEKYAALYRELLRLSNRRATGILPCVSSIT